MACVVNFPSFSTDPLKVLALSDQVDTVKGAAKIYAGIVAMTQAAKTEEGSVSVEWTAEGAKNVRAWLEAIGAPMTTTKSGKVQPRHLSIVSDGVKLLNCEPRLAHLTTLKASEVAAEVKAYLETLAAEGTTLHGVLEGMREKREPRTPSGEVTTGMEAIDTTGKEPIEVATLAAMRLVTYCIDKGIDVLALVESCL